MKVKTSSDNTEEHHKNRQYNSVTSWTIMAQQLLILTTIFNATYETTVLTQQYLL